MTQNIFGGYAGGMRRTSNGYTGLGGMWAWNIGNTSVRQAIATPGVLANWYIQLSAAPGAGKSYRFRLLVNGAYSDLDITIADTATSGSDLVNSAVVSAGDVIWVICTPSGTPAEAYARWYITFTADLAGETLILGSAVCNYGATRYSQLSTVNGGTGQVEALTYQVIPVSGTLRNLYVVLTGSPGGGARTYRFTVRVNGASSALTCDIVGAETSGSDEVHDVAVSPGDIVDLMIEPLNSPNQSPNAAVGVCFAPDSAGNALILGGTQNSPSQVTPQGIQIWTGFYNVPWHNVGSYVWQASGATALANLNVLVQNAPGSGKSWEFAVYINGVESALKCTVADLATAGSNTTDKVEVNAGDLVELVTTPSGGPASGRAYWGLTNGGKAAPAACYGLHQGAMLEMLS
jgi:hypothetical protein